MASMDVEGDFEYDLAVLGGGSGGLACARRAAEHGARVIVFDFVTPTQHGTKWGLGGTCVNVGCIPKKLMHTAAVLGERMDDAKAFGWSYGERKHDWEELAGNVNNHIKSLNFGYTVALRSENVKYKNELASMVDAHTVKGTTRKGKETTYTAKHVVVAVGGRPTLPDFPGAEHAISSDDIFYLKKAPGKTLSIGASYVSLECAGFLAGLGYDTTVMVRSILLRGFDRECADMIGDYMAKHGVKFLQPATPSKIEKLEDGKLEVTFNQNGEEKKDIFDTVLLAIGRRAETGRLNLEAAGVNVLPNGKIECVNEQSNVPHIFAIGDVLQGRPELTPVAIQAGKLLADRLYAGATKQMDYDGVPTTVFTPLEYGNCGLSEDEAVKRLGDNAEVYHSFFKPTEWTVPARPDNTCFAKVVVDKSDNDRVVGFHVLGENAGEITQGFGVAMKCGLTKAQLDDTVGIHPTAAEVFTTLTVTKSSGASVKQAGC